VVVVLLGRSCVVGSCGRDQVAVLLWCHRCAAVLSCRTSSCGVVVPWLLPNRVVASFVVVGCRWEG
jgi:hypothetical protein